ncbi:MAG: hypothetical protein ABI665_27215 [Vicinamibacterales bacterium]
MAQTDSWLGSPVTHHHGTLTEIDQHLPRFARSPFRLTQPGHARVRGNDNLHIVARQPFKDDPDFVPVGVVSSDYALVPHDAVLDMAVAALKKAGIASDNLTASVKITALGERMCGPTRT